MWDQTLHQIDRTKTPLKAANLWGIDADSLLPVSEGINFVYSFKQSGQLYYLRLTHPNLRSHLELKAAIDFQSFLFEQGVPVCQPVPSLAYHYIEEVSQEDHVFLAHVNKAVPGVPLDFQSNDIGLYQKWGEALALMHRASKQYKGDLAVYKTWADLWMETHALLVHEPSFIQHEYHLIDEAFKQLTKSDDYFGLTHGDHRTANVLYDEQHISFIDFDEPVYHWYMADITRPFLNLIDQDFSLWKDKLTAYLSGYQSILPIQEPIDLIMPWFIRMKNLEIYLWLKHSWLDETAPGGGSKAVWLQELERHIKHPLIKIAI